MTPRQTFRSVRIPKDFPCPSRIPPKTGEVCYSVFSSARIRGSSFSLPLPLLPFSIGDVNVLGPRGLQLWLHRPCISAQPCDRPSLRCARVGKRRPPPGTAESKYLPQQQHSGDKTALAPDVILYAANFAQLLSPGVRFPARGSGAWRRWPLTTYLETARRLRGLRMPPGGQILQALQILQHFWYSLNMHLIARRTILGSLVVFPPFSFAIP